MGQPKSSENLKTAMKKKAPLLFALPWLLISAPRAAAQSWPALAPDGANDYASATTTIFPNSASLQSFTIESWIYPTAAASVIATDDAYELILFFQSGAANGGVGIRFTLYGATGSPQTITEFRDVRFYVPVPLI